MFPTPWISLDSVGSPGGGGRDSAARERHVLREDRNQLQLLQRGGRSLNGAGRGVPFNIPKHPKRDSVSVKMHTI